MSIRVCPICDKKMKYAHFCTDCKTFIKEPVFWDRTYNLNGYGMESTIVNQCENHDHSRENATGKVRTDYKKPVYSEVAKQRQQEQKRTEKKKKIEQQTRERQAQQNSGPAKKRKSIIVGVLIFYIVVQVLIPILTGIFSLMFRW